LWINGFASFAIDYLISNGGFAMKTTNRENTGGAAPIVFVHGLAGWGGDAGLNRAVPYWGGEAGSTVKHLHEQGYECYAASVGPFSSAWDRACDLYAQLAGARTDYGAAHAAAHGHARYGESYEVPLVPGWDTGRGIHLVGHSFGGATIRLFAQLMEEGSAEERAVTPAEELSPLFGGAMTGRIVSVTTIAAPHNGSTVLEPEIGGASGMLAFMTGVAHVATDLPLMDHIYPAHLEQFGITFEEYRRAPRETTDALHAFINTSDCARQDLSVDGAATLNRNIRCRPGIYYFSYAAQMTEEDAGGNHVPQKGMIPPLRRMSGDMGRRREPFRTAGGRLIDNTWLPNDGQVNVISALYPFNEPHADFDPANPRLGVWQVMPVVEGRDHFTIAAAVEPWGSVRFLREFYLSLAKLLAELPRVAI
jgi:triacylglycerol lipase